MAAEFALGVKGCEFKHGADAKRDSTARRLRHPSQRDDSTLDDWTPCDGMLWLRLLWA